MSCETCRLWTGKIVSHAECPLRANLTCRRCCGAGHSTAECTHQNTLHPVCLEDLISPDLKDYYQIKTQTEYLCPDLPIAPHAVNRVDIVNQDKWIRDFMKHKHLATARKREENLSRILEWAAGSGLNIRILSQEA